MNYQQLCVYIAHQRNLPAVHLGTCIHDYLHQTINNHSLTIIQPLVFGLFPYGTYTSAEPRAYLKYRFADTSTNTWIDFRAYYAFPESKQRSLQLYLRNPMHYFHVVAFTLSNHKTTRIQFMAILVRDQVIESMYPFSTDEMDNCQFWNNVLIDLNILTLF